MEVNFWRVFSVPEQLAALHAAPSLRLDRSAYATKLHQKRIDIRGYRMIQESYTPDVHKKRGA